MSGDYWRGRIAPDDSSASMADAWHASGEAPTTPPDHVSSEAVDSASSPEAPQVREQSAQAYWQGTYHPERPGASPSAPLSAHGAVSARARQVYAAEALRQKDHVAAGLLAIFLGVFGVHKFYLGCNQAGFIMLAVSIIGGIFTFGLAAVVIEVISIIEGVMYLTKSQTEFDRDYVLSQRDWF